SGIVLFAKTRFKSECSVVSLMILSLLSRAPRTGSLDLYTGYLECCHFKNYYLPAQFGTESLRAALLANPSMAFSASQSSSFTGIQISCLVPYVIERIADCSAN